MIIFIKSATGRLLTIEVEPQNTIREVIDIIKEAYPEEMPKKYMPKLVTWSGTELKDLDATLKMYNITKEMTIVHRIPMGPMLANNDLGSRDSTFSDACSVYSNALYSKISNAWWNFTYSVKPIARSAWCITSGTLSVMALSAIPVGIGVGAGLGIYASHSALDVFDPAALGHALGGGIPITVVACGLVLIPTHFLMSMMGGKGLGEFFIQRGS